MKVKATIRALHWAILDIKANSIQLKNIPSLKSWNFQPIIVGQDLIGSQEEY